MQEQEKPAAVTLRLGSAEARALYEAAAGNPPASPEPLTYRTAMRKLQEARFPNRRKRDGRSV